MEKSVLDAMIRGAQTFVDMKMLLEVAGNRIAKLTQNEAAYITPGCASAITLSILALSELDISKSKDEVLIDHSHRIPYDQAITFAGKKIIEFGDKGKRTDNDLLGAISEKTLAIFWVAGSYVGDNSLDLISTIRLAKVHNIPVIVDAAAQLPPVSNLSYFTGKCGADIVLFSGGKALRGPQSTGLILGSSKIIEAAAKLAAPNQGIARPFKVGKEEIFGILQAVENYIELDHVQQLVRWESDCDEIILGLSKIPGVSGKKMESNQAGQPTPRVRIEFSDKFPTNIEQEIYSNLIESDPSIVLDFDQSLFISPDMLEIGEIKIVLKALTDAVSKLVSNT
jgi:L-seryl-tRNA(Ser) seleniumtransferase